jgi:hypothetical protein
MSIPVPVRIDADLFGIEIRFRPHSETPSRVFRTMSALIESFEHTDRLLIRSITSRIKPILTLEDVAAGSILTWLKNRLESLDDEALKSGDVKKVIGAYLVLGKKIIIDYCNKRTTIGSRAEVDALQAALLRAASDTDVLRIPTYRPPPPFEIVEAVRMIAESTGPLQEGDSVQYRTLAGNSELNLSFHVAPSDLEEFLVKEAITSSAPMILKIKKPDFLGESMWEFQFSGRMLPARIADIKWLSEFRGGEISILPGDALRAVVSTTVKYGFDADVVGSQYEIVKVLEVIPGERPLQIPLA